MPVKSNPLAAALRGSAAASAPAPAEVGKRPAKGTRLVGAHFPEPVHRQLRVLAAQEGRTVRSVLAEALNSVFAKRNLPPIA